MQEILASLEISTILHQIWNYNMLLETVKHISLQRTSWIVYLSLCQLAIKPILQSMYQKPTGFQVTLPDLSASSQKQRSTPSSSSARENAQPTWMSAANTLHRHCFLFAKGGGNKCTLFSCISSDSLFPSLLRHHRQFRLTLCL